MFTEVLFPKKRFANIKTHGVSQILVNSGKQLHKINGLEMLGAKVLDNFCTNFSTRRKFDIVLSINLVQSFA